jgi:hypothetical protein
MKIHDHSLKEGSFPVILDIDDEIIFILTDRDQGFLGVDMRGHIRLDYSQYWDKGELTPLFSMQNNMLYMVYSDQLNTVFAVAKSVDSDNDRILWNGFRNGSAGLLTRVKYSRPSPPETMLEIFVYPNPIRQGAGNIRINNSQSAANIRVFNISGQLVISQEIEPSLETFRDYRFDATRFSTGTYFIIVDIDGKSYRDKFAVIR